jgi:hypothetical protein
LILLARSTVNFAAETARDSDTAFVAREVC